MKKLTEQVGTFRDDGKWTPAQREQNKQLLGKIPHFIQKFMQGMVVSHYKYRTHGHMLGTLCYLTIYENAQSQDLMFEFKMCPDMTGSPGTVIHKRHIWTQYDDKWRTYCFMLPLKHPQHQEAYIWVTSICRPQGAGIAQ